MPRSHYYVEYAGGLGDIFQQMYAHGTYSALEHLANDEAATVTLITHNPFAPEIFANHPKKNQFEVNAPGYWLPEEDEVNRRRLRLPPFSSRAYAPGPAPRRGPVTYYPNDADAAAVRDLFSPHERESRPILVFSMSAGEPHKSIPAGLVRQLVAGVAGAGCVPVFVGRTYERNFREEQKGSWINEGIDLIDRLTVPGTARLVQLAAGIVCCHSSINMLAAMERKPQLLLYPESIFETFIRPRTIWAAGIDDPDTVHGLFDDYNTRMMERFLMRVAAKTKQPLARKAVDPARIEVREFLETLPNLKNPITGEDYRQADWFSAWNGYPCYTRAAELIRPKSILEIGAFLGLGLAAFIHGAPKVERVTALDNESYVPGSQELCAANLSFFGGEKHFARSLEETRGTYDLIHVDADDTFQGALDDIAFAWGLGPRVMLVDDYGFLENVRRAVQAFATHHSLPYKVWQSYRGWAVFARPKVFDSLPDDL